MNKSEQEVLYDVLGGVEREVIRAAEKHRPMHSAHEGYAVIKEEFEELWDEIKTQHPNMDKMREEAIQLAAMAVRFVMDVCK